MARTDKDRWVILNWSDGDYLNPDDVETALTVLQSVAEEVTRLVFQSEYIWKPSYQGRIELTFRHFRDTVVANFAPRPGMESQFLVLSEIEIQPGSISAKGLLLPLGCIVIGGLIEGAVQGSKSGQALMQLGSAAIDAAVSIAVGSVEDILRPHDLSGRGTLIGDDLVIWIRRRRDGAEIIDDEEQEQYIIKRLGVDGPDFGVRLGRTSRRQWDKWAPYRI